MSLYGITPTGFNPKPIDVLEEEAKTLLKQMFGTSVDLSQQSVLWKVEQVPIVEMSQLWTLAEVNFYNNYITTAEGFALDLVGEDIGLPRVAAQPAEVSLNIYKTGTGAVTVPLDSLFQTLEGIIFATNVEITIPSGDPLTTYGTVLATAVNAGIAGIVSANTITTPTNSISGVDRSDNPAASYGGEDIETDTAYRLRLREYVRAVWTLNAIRSAALNVPDVAGVKIIEAATSYTCLIVPRTTFTPALQQAVEDAIGAVTAITVEYFVIEAERVEIYIDADVVLADLYSEADAEADARNEIEAYIASLGIDDDVIKAKIIKAIMNISNIYNVVNLLITPRAIDESHTYSTGTLTYSLHYTTGIDGSNTSVRGTFGGSSHTFVKGVDYNFSASPAQIVWTGTADLPDNGTLFYVTYEYPANGYGDAVIRQENVAKFGGLDFTEM